MLKKFKTHKIRTLNLWSIRLSVCPSHFGTVSERL